MAQELINIGTVANDRTGDTWRDAFNKANDNFTELYDNPLTNVHHINSVADFPDPVGGVISIGGGVDTYLFSADTIDISPNVLNITGGVVVFRGSNRFSSQLMSTSTSPLITVVNCFYADEFMNFSNVNGPIYDVDNSGLATATFVSVNGIIRSCTTVGTISNTFTISLRTVTIGTTSVGGWSFSGTGLLQLNISNMLGFNWAGTLLDLGTATWDLINIGTGSRFISPSGTTILSGAASSANLMSDGRGLVGGNIFNGLGTALSGITTQDLQWEFSGNVFADGTTENTRRDADAYMLVLESVANAGSGVYGPIAGGNWLSDISNNFSVDSDGIMTYIGLNSIDTPVSSSATVEKGGGGSALICCKIAIDTGSGFAVIDKTIGCTQNATPTQITSTLLTSITTGDKFQLWVSIDDGSSTIEVSNARMITGGA